MTVGEASVITDHQFLRYELLDDGLIARIRFGVMSIEGGTKKTQRDIVAEGRPAPPEASMDKDRSWRSLRSAS
jgi:hypothetical protein